MDLIMGASLKPNLHVVNPTVNYAQDSDGVLALKMWIIDPPKMALYDVSIIFHHIDLLTDIPKSST